MDGASDHGVSEALYLLDSDDNGVELYWDRPSEVWPRTPQGELVMFTRRLDLNGLLGEVEEGRDAPAVEEGHGTCDGDREPQRLRVMAR
jgi:catechol 2,3-dioxygenase